MKNIKNKYFIYSLIDIDNKYIKLAVKVMVKF